MFDLVSFKANLEVYAFGNLVDINKACKKLGHVGKDILHETLIFYGVKLTG